MSESASEARILSASGSWRATPWNDSSLRYLCFLEDGAGEVIYGYGQTIYAVIKCHWAVTRPGMLHLSYLESPPY
jgi:hypothetical protein